MMTTQAEPISLEKLKHAAEKAGMAKFMFLDKDKGPKESAYVIGHDFIDRLHEQLSKQVK